jgi:plastocyanin
MPHHSRRKALLAGLLSLGMTVAIAGPAFGASDHKTVKLFDDCEAASFNMNVPPFPGLTAACVGDGETTFAAFVAEFAANGSVDDWAFSRDEFGLDAGGVITAVDEGGEPHTFTEVGSFGAGCVPPLNGFEPVAATNPVTGAPIDCATEFVPQLIAPGASRTVTVATPGTHRFQCLIHPWMRAVVTVDGRGGGRD